MKKMTLSTAFTTCKPVTLNGARQISLSTCDYTNQRRRVTTCVAWKQPGANETVTAFHEMLNNLWRRVSGQSEEEEEVIQTPFTSIGTSEGSWRFLLSTTIIAKEGTEKQMAKLLQSLEPVAKENQLLFRAVNQDPEERSVFLVVEHFGDQGTMTKYQQTKEYQAFIREVQTILEKPMGVHICKERDGQISSGYYPFGPSGEGGRDDMARPVFKS